jgi:periplasmic protein TonB
MKKLLALPLLLIPFLSFAQKTTSSTASDTTKEKAQVIVETQAVFPGGFPAMYKFIGENFKYPKEEMKAGIEGMVYLSFIIEKDGSISNIQVLKGVKNGPGLDAEAVRVVSMMPKWKPAENNGRVVRQQFNLPIKCSLGHSDNKQKK